MTQFATRLVRTTVEPEGDAFRWRREPGPAYVPPPAPLPGSLRRTLTDLHPALRLPVRPIAEPGLSLTYLAHGPLPAASWLAFPDQQPLVRQALHAAGAALAALHRLPAPPEVTRPHPGVARLATWLATGESAPALHRAAAGRLGPARLDRLLDRCATLLGPPGGDLLHGAASLALIVPGPEPALLSGEFLARGSGSLDVAWLLAELSELELAVAHGLAPALSADYEALRRAVQDGYGQPVAVEGLVPLRVLTHAHDYAAYVGWDPQLTKYLDIVADVMEGRP
ncbi:hypothetical protein [Nonomuraea sp. NPDC050310]|uniref:hypothetical protein n=1 Tax=Nonomuraea sp. NPDC050310 TaxID=3154935 RepID=UPI0034018B63